MKTIDQLTTKDFYFCYDMDLSNYLKRIGIPYFHKARSIRDNVIYTMYVHNERLHKAIEQYKHLNK